MRTFTEHELEIDLDAAIAAGRFDDPEWVVAWFQREYQRLKSDDRESASLLARVRKADNLRGARQIIQRGWALLNEPKT